MSTGRAPGTGISSPNGDELPDELGHDVAILLSGAPGQNNSFTPQGACQSSFACPIRSCELDTKFYQRTEPPLWDSILSVQEAAQRLASVVLGLFGHAGI